MARRACFALALVGACGESTMEPVEPATWYGEVGTIARTKCAGCHQPGGVAPFSLVEYGDAYEQTGKIIEAIDDGIMPPWFTDEPEDCTPRHRWREDARLTAAERAAFHAWVDAGAPEGTKRELPAIRATALDNPTVEIAPVEPFVSSGTRDQFTCFLLDPQITERKYLTGTQVYPTAPDLVHHVNVYLIGPAEAVEVRKSFALGAPTFPCDHPPGLAIQSWLPGNPALLLPDEVGIPVDAGTLVMTQVHYHPAGGGGSDATSIALRLGDDRPSWRYLLGVYGNSPGAPVLQPGPGDPDGTPAFVVPANADDHTEVMRIRHPDSLGEMRVLNMTPHMHYLGTHQRATLTHANGDRECLIDSRWDFDWQRTYTFDASLDTLPLFSPASTVEVSCRWNNSFSNPELPRLLENSGLVAPYDVWLGFATTNEMCLADVGVIVPY